MLMIVQHTQALTYASIREPRVEWHLVRQLFSRLMPMCFCLLCYLCFARLPDEMSCVRHVYPMRRPSSDRIRLPNFERKFSEYRLTSFGNDNNNKTLFSIRASFPRSHFHASIDAINKSKWCFESHFAWYWRLITFSLRCLIKWKWFLLDKEKLMKRKSLSR